MCHRQLRFVKSTGCGHLTLTGEVVIDCGAQNCQISVSHPSNCTSSECHRYYERPERLTTHQVPGKCNQCSQ
ncbi:hypothetical protein HYPSUDRAFT_35828 [Hypholoma sublateritium FD-334 SS-4]|uniref:Uncharacterized protein n=1 Tax=Hypholoma sublateritium (strain FD-334 SS-4) TaxID=945553 RepID=A0A0D2Q6G4_HYPSF|nr:hypothetical protein HYPSUDRAFT_35828 [Hypholoma sublateritium FD-334 SS-4]